MPAAHAGDDAADLEASTQGVEATSEAPNAANGPERPPEPPSRRWQLPCAFLIHRLMGTDGELALHVHYDLRFKILALFAFSASLLWVLNFFIRVLPVAAQASEGPCRFSDDQLRQNSIVLFAYFICFAVVRICIFFPGVAARIAEIRMGMQGPWRMYAIHMILHGPLYIFGIGSVLFGFQLLMSPTCDDDPETQSLHRNLGWYAGYSIFVFIACLALAFVQGRLITASARYEYEYKRRPPPGTLENLLTYTYGEDCSALFKDDDGRFAEQCPICLMDWDENDVIKVTPCEHAFHEDCLGQWLKNERTCAFCRQDVVTTVGRSHSQSRRGSREVATNTVPFDQDPFQRAEDAAEDEGVVPDEPAPQVVGAFAADIVGRTTQADETTPAIDPTAEADETTVAIDLADEARAQDVEIATI